MPELVLGQVDAAIGEKPILRDVSLRLNEGELVALLGPNGAGKTTALRVAVGLCTPTEGHATLDGRAVASLRPAERARMIGYLPQQRVLAWPSRVKDVVALGRFSHGAALGRLGAADEEAVSAALAACDLEALAGRSVETLSGGERARVHFARAYVTGAPLLVADEPVAALDPRHQFRVMDLIARFVKEGGGALIVLHELSLAARYADRVVLMKDGRIAADGPPNEVLSTALLAEIFGVSGRLGPDGVMLRGPAPGA